MSDTTAPIKPKYQLLLGMLPSLNTSLVAIVTACLSIGGTIMTQRYAAKPAEAPKPVTVERVIERPAAVDFTPITELDKSIKELTAELARNADPGRKRGLK